MRVEIGGAQVTESVAELLETLQTDPTYVRAINDGIARIIKLIAIEANLDDSEGMTLIRTLQIINRDYELMANPPELDNPNNDEPVASI